MDDLWGALEDDAQLKKDEVHTPSGLDLKEITPSEMVIYDMNNEKLVLDQTNVLSNRLVFCEQIVTAAYKVADYVPDLRNNQHAKFWKQDVIPNLVDSLKQDVRARAIMSRSLSSIRDLAITIQKSGEIVKQSRGSKKAIEIAQTNIPCALAKLNDCIEQVSKLENTAIQEFEKQTKTLLTIIGPKAVKFVDQKTEIESHLNDLYGKQQKLYTELGNKQGEVKGFNHMISATEKQVLGVNKALIETKRRLKDLARLNDEVENTIKSIPVSTPKTVSTTTHSRKGWFWWRRNSSTTTTSTQMIENTNRETEKNYYESIVLSRMSRIRDNKTDEQSKQEVMNDLNNSLSELTAKYEKSSTELDELQKSLPAKMKILQDQIDNYIMQIDDIEKRKVDISNMVGHHGNALIECLIQVRTFAKSISGSASAYAPLVSILSGIKAMVESDVQLLSSEEQRDIFLAGNRLLKQVQFLAGYSVTANKALQSSEQYKTVATERTLAIKASE